MIFQFCQLVYWPEILIEHELFRTPSPNRETVKRSPKGYRQFVVYDIIRPDVWYKTLRDFLYGAAPVREVLLRVRLFFAVCHFVEATAWYSPRLCAALQATHESPLLYFLAHNMLSSIPLSTVVRLLQRYSPPSLISQTLIICSTW